MYQFVLRRLVQSIPVLLVVSMVVFAMMRIIPGDLVAAIMGDAVLYAPQDSRGQKVEKEVFSAAAQALREQYHLDKPLYEQYLIWIGNALRGDFGVSAYSQKPVFAQIMAAFPTSLEILILGVIFSCLVSFPVGVLSALKQDTWADYVTRVLSIAALSVPSFFTGILVLLGLSIFFKYTPPMFYQPIWENPRANLEQIIFPSLLTGLILAGTQARMVRSSLLEVIRMDYVRTARAKGLAGGAVVWRHALKNSMIPVMSLMGVQIARLIGSAVIVEIIFAVPGMGLLTLIAIQRRDYPQLEASLLFYAVMLMVINLLVDLMYGIFDPRIRYGTSE